MNDRETLTELVKDINGYGMFTYSIAALTRYLDATDPQKAGEHAKELSKLYNKNGMAFIGTTKANALRAGAIALTENPALKKRVAELEAALRAYQKAYTPDGHIAPHDCFATGPLTGDPIQDLVVCPGCVAANMARRVLQGDGHE